MKRLTRILLTGMLPIMFTVVLLTSGGVRAAGLSCGAWSAVKSPNAGTSDNSLSGVAAASASNVWTVGDYFDISSRNYLTLTEFFC